MRTSPTGTTPSNLINITEGTFTRVCARNRQHVYDLLISAFKRSGLTQVELARRAGMAPEVVSRLFKRPRNIEIDTASRLLFTMTGATITLAEEYPRAAG